MAVPEDLFLARLEFEHCIQNGIVHSIFVAFVKSIWYLAQVILLPSWKFVVNRMFYSDKRMRGRCFIERLNFIYVITIFSIAVTFVELDPRRTEFGVIINPHVFNSIVNIIKIVEL